MAPAWPQAISQSRCRVNFLRDLLPQDKAAVSTQYSKGVEVLPPQEMVKGQTFFEMRVFGEAGAAEFRVTVWPRGLRWRPQKQGPLAGGGGGKCPRQGGNKKARS